MSVSDRIKKIRGTELQEVFSVKIGVHKNTVGRWERGERIPDQENLVKILQLYPEINPAWLVTGEGPMRRDAPHMHEDGTVCHHPLHQVLKQPFPKDFDDILFVEAMQAIQEELQSQGKELNHEDIIDLTSAVYSDAYWRGKKVNKNTVKVLIESALLPAQKEPTQTNHGHNEAREPYPAYDPSQARLAKVYVLAGAGTPNQLIDTEPITEIVIPAEFYKPSIVPIMVRGRSMEDTIMDGAFVGVDREDKWVISGEVYAIWIPNEGAVIKRLYLEPERIICKSDNQKFADFFVNVKDIDEHFIQGRVKWVIQKY